MDAAEDYARRWIKREVDQDPELESLSDWVRTNRSLVQGRIHKFKNCVNSRPKSVFKDQEAVKCLRWVVLKRRVGAVTNQRVLKVLFYVNILQCFFVVENFTANAVSVAIGEHQHINSIGNIISR
jgi:hypothetical protein